MVGVKGIGGVPEPAPDRQSNVRDRKREEVKIATQTDGVEISSAAKEAANVARLTQVAKSDSGVRAERVAAARERLEQGDYKLPDVLTEVARQLSKYLP